MSVRQNMKLWGYFFVIISLKYSCLTAIPLPKPYEIPLPLPKKLPPNIVKFIEEIIDSEHYTITNLGGLTNRNYLMQLKNDTQCVAKIHNLKVKTELQIENEIENQRLAYEMGIAPKVIFSNKMVAIMEYLKPIKSIKITKEDLLSCVKTIALLHNSKCEFQGKFNYQDKCRNYLQILKEQQRLEDDIEKFVLNTFSSFENLMKVISIENFSPCHNDLNSHNFLESVKGVKLIDWEDSSMNDPAWDISYFLLINFISENLENTLLDAYLSQRENNDRDLVQRVKLYRPFVLIKAGLSLLASASSKDLERKEFKIGIDMCFQGAKKIYFNQRYQDYLFKYIRRGKG